MIFIARLDGYKPPRYGIRSVSTMKIRQEWRVLGRTEEVLEGYAFLHDISVTRGHYVIFQNPVTLRMWPLLTGMYGILNILHMHLSG